jgi:ubiquinone/menaquinone biosynthesis C-methylase UbiE
MISLIHLLNMDETLIEQYKNSKNVDARIDLHKRYSVNPQGWFCWIFDNLPIQSGMKVLEVGCGNGRLWSENLTKLPGGVQIALSDISSGMLRSAKAYLKGWDNTFTYDCFNFQEIPFEEESFDLVVANHALFYAKDRDKALSELHRVLKKDGVFCCSTYGKQHLKEIELLAKEFDDRIALSEVKLYDIFGLDNGDKELSELFTSVEKRKFEDLLIVKEVLPLAEYIYSCHGNQMEYLIGKQASFEKFIQKKIGKKGLSITKDAGIFYCIK